MDMEVEEAAETFNKRLGDLLDIYAPVTTIQNRSNYCPALSTRTKDLIKKRNELRDEVHKQKKTEKNTEYKEMVNQARNSINKDKKVYIEKKLNKVATPKDSWKLAKNLMGIRTEKKTLKKLEIKMKT